jgi:hypothetical protein
MVMEGYFNALAPHDSYRLVPFLDAISFFAYTPGVLLIRRYVHKWVYDLVIISSLCY